MMIMRSQPVLPTHLLRRAALLSAIFALSLIQGCETGTPTGTDESADRIFYNGTIYTADSKHTLVEALAVKGDRILATGTTQQMQKLSNSRTRMTDLKGKLVLPGLHDAHIHPFGIIERDQCDLQSQPMSLEQIVGVLKNCLDKYAIKEGEWLAVEQWNFSEDNSPSEQYPTFRAALDAVSLNNPIILFGNDGHHGAVNSLALARARADGEVVGITRETLAGAFKEYQAVIGVDDQGEPNGELNEGARYLIDPPPVAGLGIDPSIKPFLPEISDKLARFGITSIMDAATSPEALDYYGELEASGQMTFRLTAALYPDWDKYRTQKMDAIDIGAIVSDFQKARAKYQASPLIKADTVKVFVDGVIEGNPLSSPPTLPNAAVLNAYQQPLLSFDPETETLSLNGYVDLASEDCWDVRNAEDFYQSPEARAAFVSKHGYLPEQCRESYGVLEHPEEFYADYVTRMDAAGFGVHAHVIGDRALRVALNAFAAARKHNGNTGHPMGLAHAQLIAPEDVPRMGQLKLYIAFTYGWMIPNEPYDLTVVPFIDKLSNIAALYNPDNYSYRNSYPVKSVQDAGVLLVAGSDAPVDSRDPSPFFHIQQAVTRANQEGAVYNPAERIDIYSILDAYTINGARVLKQDDLTGSLEAGKKADLIIVDQNVLELVNNNNSDQINQTRVLETLFNGKSIFQLSQN